MGVLAPGSAHAVSNICGKSYQVVDEKCPLFFNIDSISFTAVDELNKCTFDLKISRII